MQSIRKIITKMKPSILSLLIAAALPLLAAPVADAAETKQSATTGPAFAVDQNSGVLGWREVLKVGEPDKDTGISSIVFSLTGKPQETNSFLRTAYLPTPKDTNFLTEMQKTKNSFTILRREVVGGGGNATTYSVYFVDVEKGPRFSSGIVEYRTFGEFTFPTELTDYTVDMDEYWGILEQAGKKPQVFLDQKIMVVGWGPAESVPNGLWVRAMYRDRKDASPERVLLIFRNPVDAREIEWRHLPARQYLKGPADKLLVRASSEKAKAPPMVRAFLAERK